GADQYAALVFGACGAIWAATRIWWRDVAPLQPSGETSTTSTTRRTVLAALVVVIALAGLVWASIQQIAVLVGVLALCLALSLAADVRDWRRPLPAAQPRLDPALREHPGPALVLTALLPVDSYRATALQRRLDVDEPTLVAWHRTLVDLGYATSHETLGQAWLDATEVGRAAIAGHLAAIDDRKR
ncbi:hypothetical protein, partial [Janibacter melonis]|uniref:hypothetical protein n=1 Tax=Janibacter melonis TaxID=262209 RepID=UPI00177CCBBD|nr:hypothetical protein [Janibacter melonis]